MFNFAENISAMIKRKIFVKYKFSPPHEKGGGRIADG
jgi:hypothetical protein